MKEPSTLKKSKVSEIASEIEKYKTIAVINLAELPSTQLQKIRGKIRSEAKIIMTRKKLLSFALKSSKKKDVQNLTEYLYGMSALLLSNKNAFELFKLLKNNMSKAPAKAGQKAPFDLVIPKGPTSFPPGPMISELGKFGLKTAIEGGKITIKDDKVVAKEGEEITSALTNLLGKFSITPMKIGINLVCALEDSFLYMRNVLDIDEEEFLGKIKSAYLDTLKLSLGAKIITKESASHFIRSAYTDAKKLGIGAEILADDVKEYLLMKAQAQVNALKLKLNV